MATVYVDLEADIERVVRKVLVEQAHGADDGYLDSDGAAKYLSTTRQRIYTLKSVGELEPDGWDGKRPLYLPSSLRAYAERGNRLA